MIAKTHAKSINFLAVRFSMSSTSIFARQDQQDVSGRPWSHAP